MKANAVSIYLAPLMLKKITQKAHNVNNQRRKVRQSTLKEMLLDQGVAHLGGCYHQSG